jgi:hypothetical protein
MSTTELQGAAQRFSNVRLRLAALAGQDAAIAAERTALARGIALAKAQVELAPQVDTAFEYLQEKAHARAVGELEGLLTAFVEDVVPQAGTIRLELGTERQAPALDVFLDNGGELESVLDGNGGGLTNAVVTGLAFSALARSGNRQLMVLDEPDCWLKARYVPAFTKVLAQVANPEGEAPGCQTLMISHNDVGLMDEGAHLQELRLEMDPAAFAARAGLALRYEGEPGPCAWVTWEVGAPGSRGTVVVRYRKDEAADADNDALTKGFPWVQSLSGARAWENDTVAGIRAIEVFNLRHHVYTHLELSSGLNVLAGDINAGKSTLYLTALRAIAYGETDDTMIRHGADSCRVRLILEKGIELEVERRRKGSPRVLFRMFEGGALTHEARPETKNAVPDFIAEALGVYRIDDLDVQLRSQKQPVFLLNESPARRAKILSVGREAGLLQQMAERQRLELRRAREALRRDEPRHALLSRKLKALESVGELQALASLMQESLEHLQGLESEIKALESVLPRIERAKATLQLASDALAGGVTLPVAPALSDCARMAHVADALEERAKILRVARLVPARMPAPPAAERLAQGARLAHYIDRLEHGRGIAALPVLAQVPVLQERGVRMAGALEGMVGRMAKVYTLAHADIRLPAIAHSPQLFDVAKLLSMGKACSNAIQAQEEGVREYKKAQDALAAGVSALEAARARIGVCPLCEQPMDSHAGHSRHSHGA